MRYMLLGVILGLIGCNSEPPVGPRIDALKAILRSANESQTGELKATREELVENTAALNAIRSKIEELNSTVAEKIPTPKQESPETTPPVETAPGVSPATAPSLQSPGGVATHAAQTDVPLYVSVAFGCAPCERLKADHAAGKFAGFAVKFASDWTPRVYPAIRYPSKASKTGWAVIYGYNGQSTIDKLKSLTSENGTLLATPVEAPAAMSHSDMVSLHNHLHGGGQWTWPGDLAIHLQQAHGVSSERLGNGFAAYQSTNPFVSQRYNFRSVSRWGNGSFRSKGFFRSSVCSTCPGS